MLPSEAQTVPSREVQCDLDYRIIRAQASPQIHLSNDCAHMNFLVPGMCSHFRPYAGLNPRAAQHRLRQGITNQAERIANVMTAIGFVQNRKAVGNGNKQRGWWPSDQPDRPKRRF